MIGELEEQDALTPEVHQAFAATSPSSAAVPVLPPYLDRPGFDDRLRAAVAAAIHGSQLVMVVGSRAFSSSGGGACLTGRRASTRPPLRSRAG